MTVLLANVTAFETMVALRCVNGVFLACLNPISQGIVSDITTSEERGTVFGSLLACVKFGELVGMAIAIPLSGRTVLGHAGWRAAYCLVGAASILTSFRVSRRALALAVSFFFSEQVVTYRKHANFGC